MNVFNESKFDCYNFHCLYLPLLIVIVITVMHLPQVVDWILGPAEKLLMSQAEVGDSFRTADELRKQHEQLELKCMVNAF